jgi:hypothetical protein
MENAVWEKVAVVLFGEMSDRTQADKRSLLTELAALSQDLDVERSQCVNRDETTPVSWARWRLRWGRWRVISRAVLRRHSGSWI